MKFIADFHIHSKYSRAVSQEMNVESLDKWARIKGIKVLGTGDFTHPQWLAELKEKLEPAEPGLYKLKVESEKLKVDGNFLNEKNESEKSEESKTRFILTSEISNIYSKNGHGRRIHNVIFAPSFETVDKINTQLSWIGNLKSDGRPILGLDSEELLKIILNISEDCILIPAHAWTPWFGVFGSQSGFDSLKECFGDWTKYIYAIETGLSSDPAMNWRWSALDNITLISNSDAHSPANLGREANIFEGDELNYKAIIEAIKLGAKISQNSPKLKLTSTIEFFPQEGKYHFDGHRNCQVVFSPKETKEHKNICPKCNKSLTVGVMNRVEKLADRPEGGKPEKIIPFKCLIPLQEIIADVFGMGKASKTVQEEYKKMVSNLGSEFKILLDKSKEEIENVASPLIAEGIIRVREEKVKIHPGYDGEFGKIEIFSSEEKEGIKKGGSMGQKSLL